MSSQEAQSLHIDPVLSLGHVQSVCEDYYLVASSCHFPHTLTRAKRATSCLIEPQKGDMILLMLAEGSDAYIVHILERGTNEATLILPSQTQICLDSPKHRGKSLVNAPEQASSTLKIRAQNMECTCSQSLSMTSEKITASAQTLSLGAKNMLLTGQVLYSRFDSMRTTCKHVVEKIHHFFGSYHKKIDHAQDSITMHSKRTSITNTESLRIQNKNTHIRSENSVDMDAKNIRIG